MIIEECNKCGCQWEYEGVCVNGCPDCKNGEIPYSIGLFYKPLIIKHGKKENK